VRALLVTVALVGVTSASACKKAKPPNATRAECEEYRDKLFSLLPDNEREAGTRMGMHKATKLELDLCEQRMTSDEVACALVATTQADALACKPKVDIRPADAKRTPDECKAFTEHVMKLGRMFESTETPGPPFTKAMAAMLARECERWMTQKRYDCVMKSGSTMDLMGCRP